MWMMKMMLDYFKPKKKLKLYEKKIREKKLKTAQLKMWLYFNKKWWHERILLGYKWIICRK